jgi:hypothetical protein
MFMSSCITQRCLGPSRRFGRLFRAVYISVWGSIGLLKFQRPTCTEANVLFHVAAVFGLAAPNHNQTLIVKRSCKIYGTVVRVPKLLPACPVKLAEEADFHFRSLTVNQTDSETTTITQTQACLPLSTNYSTTRNKSPSSPDHTETKKNKCTAIPQGSEVSTFIF